MRPPEDTFPNGRMDDLCYYVEGCLLPHNLTCNTEPRARLGTVQNFSRVVSEGNDFKGGAMVLTAPLLETICGLVCCVCLSSCGWWSSLGTSPLAGTAEPPNLELSEVDDPDGGAVPHIEKTPEAPRQPTAGSCLLDTETQSAQSRAAIPKWTRSQATKMRSLL